MCPFLAHVVFSVLFNKYDVKFFDRDSQNQAQAHTSDRLQQLQITNRKYRERSFKIVLNLSQVNLRRTALLSLLKAVSLHFMPSDIIYNVLTNAVVDYKCGVDV